MSNLRVASATFERSIIFSRRRREAKTTFTAFRALKDTAKFKLSLRDKIQ